MGRSSAPLVSVQMALNRVGVLMCLKIGRHLDQWVEDGCKRFINAKCQVLHLCHSNPMQCCNLLRGEWLKNCLAEKDLIVSQQCAPVAKRPTSIMACIRNSVAGRTAEVIVCLYLALARLHLKYCIQVWTPHCQRHMEVVEHGQRRATKLVEGLEKKFFKKLRELWWLSLEKWKPRGDLIALCIYLKGAPIKVGVGLFTQVATK